MIVADNASTDGTPEHVCASFPDIRLVELAANHGFAVACNAGAPAGDGDVIVLVNNDVECPPDFLERLVAPLGDGYAARLRRRRARPAGGTNHRQRRADGRPNPGRLPRLRGHSLADVRSASPILAGPAGAAGAYRRVAWLQIGGLDEQVFMYGEDLELALRLRAAGWQTALAPDAIAVHLGSASIRHRSTRSGTTAGSHGGTSCVVTACCEATPPCEPS